MVVRERSFGHGHGCYAMALHAHRCTRANVVRRRVCVAPMRLETRRTYLGVQRKAYTALRATTLIPLHHTLEGLDTFFN